MMSLLLSEDEYESVTYAYLEPESCMKRRKEWILN